MGSCDDASESEGFASYAARAVNLGSRACFTRARFVRLHGNAVSPHLRSHTRLRAIWGWSEWPFPPATQQQTPRAESYAQHRPQLKESRS
jgi:hypothetical protein